MQHLTYVVFINLAHYYGKRLVPAVHVVNSRFRLCTSFVPRPTIVAFDLGRRLHVRMHTKLENGILHNGQPTQSVVNGFSDQGECEAMKTLSYRCLTSGLNKERRQKMALLLPHTFAFSCLPCGFWPLI